MESTSMPHPSPHFASPKSTLPHLLLQIEAKHLERAAYIDWSDHFYTDGSIEPDSGTVGATFVMQDTTALFRLTDGSSIFFRLKESQSLKPSDMHLYPNTISFSLTLTLQQHQRLFHMPLPLTCPTSSPTLFPFYKIFVALVPPLLSAGSQAMQVYRATTMQTVHRNLSPSSLKLLAPFLAVFPLLKPGFTSLPKTPLVGILLSGTIATLLQTTGTQRRRHKAQLWLPPYTTEVPVSSFTG